MSESFLGVPIEYHSTIGSTNDEVLRRAAEGAPEGLVVQTDEQTAGRGRQGRSWWDAPGSSLLFSLLLRPATPLPRYPLFGIAMACAVAEAAGDASGEPLLVKWPNDVLHAGRKLCGILAEARPMNRGESILVLGTGVNVNQTADSFPSELRERATSVRIAAGGRLIDRQALLGAVLARFDAYRLLAAREGAEALRLALLPRLPVPGSPIVVQVGERRIEGLVEEILETGALLVRNSDGARVPIAAGEIPLGAGGAT